MAGKPVGPPVTEQVKDAMRKQAEAQGLSLKRLGEPRPGSGDRREAGGTRQGEGRCTVSPAALVWASFDRNAATRSDRTGDVD